MADSKEVRLPRVALLGALVLLLLGLLVAWQCFVKGSYTITQGGRHSPKKVWHFTGPEAIRIGWGGAALTGASLLLLVNTALLGRSRRALGLRLTATLALFAAAYALFLPPWRIAESRVIASFYGFLIPALTGVVVRQIPWALLIGILAGVAVAAVVGGSSSIPAIFAGLTAYASVGGHLGLLTSGRLERPRSPRRDNAGGSTG